MNLVLQQLPIDVRGDVRAKLLAPEAAVSLKTVERETEGLSYTSMWHDATTTMLRRRLGQGNELPGYDPHNYGLAITLNGLYILSRNSKVSYKALLVLMKANGWYCHRQDGKDDDPGSFEFYYLGDAASEYIGSASYDPNTWINPIERKIHDKHFNDFALSPAQVQSHLLAMGFFHGEVDGNNDIYLREAIMAFQRAWGMPETGTMSVRLQRALAFVGANISITR